MRIFSPIASDVDVHRERSSWFGSSTGYTVCAPLATIAGAATTVAAPILLDPAGFASFALLFSIFQYAGDFDLGLSRLMDRKFPKQDASTRLRQLPSFIVARLCVAAVMIVIVSVGALVSRAPLIAVAGLGGVAFMLSNGPVAFHRATSNMFAFSATALLMQSGMSLPRFFGLYFGGLPGCLLTTAAWFAVTAIVVNAPFVTVLRNCAAVRIGDLLRSSVPLCAFSSLWLTYLLSSRWFSWSMSAPAEAGLFAFGANLLTIGVGLVGLVSPAYYPRHLAASNKTALNGELVRLLALVTFGVLVGSVFCRFGLGWLLPHFQNASAPTAVILISGIPLCLCAWLMPLVIARSRNPWREAFAMFGLSLGWLYALMRLGANDGVQGQSWALLPPAVGLLGMQLYLVVQVHLLGRKQALILWINSVIGVAVCIVIWYQMFRLNS